MSNGRQFVLGVDLDGVCGDYIGTFRRIVAERLGVPAESLTRDVSWGCQEWGIQTPEEFDELHRHAVLERHMLRHMDLIPGAAEALWRLSDAGVWIRVVTHRLYVNWGHAVTAGDTAEWLDTARIPYRDLCFIAAKSSVNADAFVDDAPHQIEDLRARAIPPSSSISPTTATCRIPEPPAGTRWRSWCETSWCSAPAASHAAPRHRSRGRPPRPPPLPPSGTPRRR